MTAFGDDIMDLESTTSVRNVPVPQKRLNGVVKRDLGVCGGVDVCTPGDKYLPDDPKKGSVEAVVSEWVRQVPVHPIPTSDKTERLR